MKFFSFLLFYNFLIINVLSQSVDGEIQKITIEFIYYDDDFKYSLLNGIYKKDEIQFVNEAIKDRNFLAGDKVEIQWKYDTVSVSGDENSVFYAKKIVSSKKIKNGYVAKFRKSYTKEMHFHWIDENYSDQYLDKIYLNVERYVAKSKNKLIKAIVKNNENLLYSIEQQIYLEKKYTFIGVGIENENHFNVFQWLYFDSESNILYEYDLASDQLIKFSY